MMKKRANYLTTISIFFCLITYSCNVELPICTGLTDSIPINHDDIKIEQSSGVSSNWTLSFNPLFLPVKIIYSLDKGFSVIHTGEQTIITPIGSVGLQYSLGSQSVKNINGYQITSGDFVVGIIDRNKNIKQLFKIEGYNRLKVVVEGSTSIDAQNGYVEIDVTNSSIKELKFIDNARIAIVNTTDKKQKFSLVIRDISSSVTTYKCEVDPKSFKYFPRFDLSKSVNSYFNSTYSIKIINDDLNNNLQETAERKVDFGEVCQIKSGNNNKVFLERLAHQ